jgi:hypothetical protein
MLIVTVVSPIDIIPRINFGSWGRGWGKCHKTCCRREVRKNLSGIAVCYTQYRNFWHIWKSRSKKSLFPTSCLQRKTKVLHFNSICTMFVFACYPSSICDKVWESLAWGGTFPWTGVSDISHIVSHIECVYHLFYHSYSLCVCAFVYDIPCVLLIQHGLLCLVPLGVLKTYLGNILLDAY